jgi:hypothetical protein
MSINPEERSSQILRGGSLKSRIVRTSWEYRWMTAVSIDKVPLLEEVHFYRQVTHSNTDLSC